MANGLLGRCRWIAFVDFEVSHFLAFTYYNSSLHAVHEILFFCVKNVIEIHTVILV